MKNKGIFNFFKKKKKSNKFELGELVSNIVQITYILIILIFTLVWYFMYYKPKLNKRLANNTQKVLDDEFVVFDSESQTQHALAKGNNINS